jgi:hypothetical protein
MEIKRGWWMLAGFAVLTVLALYIGTYYATVRYRRDAVIEMRSGIPIMLYQARYIIGDPVSRRIFFPIHYADRCIRRSAWEFESPDILRLHKLREHYGLPPLTTVD